MKIQPSLTLIVVLSVSGLCGCASPTRNSADAERREIIEAHLAWRSASAFRSIQTLSSNMETFVYGPEYDHMVALAKHSDIALEHLYGQFHETILSGDYRDRLLSFAIVDALGWDKSGIPVYDYEQMHGLLVVSLDLRRRSLASYRNERPALLDLAPSKKTE